ncbi:MAG: 2-dehydropantoate 2-reductase [Planctomycetota bacterium]
MKKTAIIGAGPIGSILAAHLAQNKQPVILVDVLKPHLDIIKEKGIVISGVSQINVKIPDICYEISQLKNLEIDYLFICVKATVLQNIMTEVKKVISGQTNVISFQNGIDTEELVSQYVGAARTLRVVINYAGNLIANGQVKMSFFNKPNYIGAIFPATGKIAQEIAGMMTQAGLDTEFTPEIKKYAWEKTILNAALSPVTALTGQTMKQAMDFPETRRLVVSLLEEGVAVAKAIPDGTGTGGYDYGADFMNHCLNYLDKAGHHKTSMHIDVEAGRKTEIDFLNKKIVEYGQKMGLPTPYHETIVRLIKGIENRFIK